MWYPRPYQAEKAGAAVAILKEYGLVYLAMEERTGKSLTALVAAELTKVNSVLVVTKAKALPGWKKHLDNYHCTKTVTLTTYGKAHKLNSADYDMIILDESHNYISAFPVASATWKKLAPMCKLKPIIYISATPHAQGYQQLYHQFKLSTWSPFHETSAYDWFDKYGIPNSVWIAGRSIPTYNETNESEVRAITNHLFVTGTRKELGFTYEPKDKLHYVQLSDNTKLIYNELLKTKVIVVQGIALMADSPAKLRCALHMLEGGTLKLTDVLHKEYKNKPFKYDHIVQNKGPNQVVVDLFISLNNNEKVKFIKSTWGDTGDMVIMYNYIAEKLKLEKAFTNALVVQATSNAEGVDYTNYKHLIIYSQDFSTARHTQRRARQSSKHRQSEIVVHYLLVENGVSEQVYDTVSVNKVNFVDSRFNRKELL